jgi:hypothetical protein
MKMGRERYIPCFGCLIEEKGIAWTKKESQGQHIRE